MLGREDAAYERLQRKKKLKAQQAAILTQQRKAATALVQRVYRGHRARLQAGALLVQSSKSLRALLVLV
jgi:hypothetical protein